MSFSLSVLIAAANEEARIGLAVDSAFAAGAAEVIVCDGASEDQTTDIAERHGAQVLRQERFRARQYNAGAAIAKGDALLFLHADTTLPLQAGNAIERCIGQSPFGGFRVRFEEKSLKLRLAERMINLRCSFTSCPWGDQGQFIARDAFSAIGGFRDIPLMEDYDLAIRMKQRGPTIILPYEVQTSGRRFLNKGLLRTAATNWRIIARYRLGADPSQLADEYRR